MRPWFLVASFVLPLVGCAGMLGFDDVDFNGKPTPTDTSNPSITGGADASLATEASTNPPVGNFPDGGTTCAPVCAGKTCGANDGCGGKCTGCPASGLTCDPVSWTCKNPACTPNCTGKKCGDADGCGSMCTQCSGGLTCNTTSGTCVTSCTASCAGKSCGDTDGCSGKCSACPAGQTCNMGASACQAICVPNCAGKNCGDSDGCGGKCTGCPSAGQGCDTTTGQCVACTKSCGANGSCVFGWESGQHCHCNPGYYETLSGCSPVTGSPCDGVTCSGRGTCFAGPPFNQASCHCEGDSVEYGLACAPLNRIRCIDRDGKLQPKGTIRCSADDTKYEVCRDGDGDGTVEWAESGTATCDSGSSCSACKDSKCNAGDGTGGRQCPTGTVCMSKVHEIDVYLCVAGCDCSNCGTCDPEDFTGYQRACGSSGDTFNNPTIACKSPCANANEGCLPYGQFAFCFPSEGCASGTP